MDPAAMTQIESDAMRRAIALSALGIGTTSPNPPVGCVILDSTGALVGQGYHRRKGEPHAEANALVDAGTRAADGIALVTLEPCNHHGRTPPCHQALIGAGISRVVIAVLDPTSRGDGGASGLRAAGIPVEVGLHADEALVVLGPWLTALRTGRPQVTWTYELGPYGPRAVDTDLAEVIGLRYGFDAILNSEGSIHEGIPDGHGPGAFTLPPRGEASPAALAALYAGGTRRLALNGGRELADPFLEIDTVDRVLAYLVAPTDRADNWQLFPPGFELTALRRTASGVVIEAKTSRTNSDT